mmetsp:Transcript_45054/g.101405  ORF Transcript_45054/g.101405 Transcript_45054/m.101405 type:complete len:249 (-) Transcript_45054:87-833(-)
MPRQLDIGTPPGGAVMLDRQTVWEKRLIVFRHGQGHHQTDGQAIPGLGYILTELGVAQAKGVQRNPLFARAMQEARCPAFVASNMVRAVETMVNAAPGAHVIIQPLLREINGTPSGIESLEAWLRERNVAADLRECHVSATSASGRVGGQQPLQLYTACHMIPELINWLGNLEADTIFVASHGGLLALLDHAAGSPCAFLWGLLTCSAGFCDPMQNCAVREYRLVRRPRPGAWALRRPGSDGPCSCLC